MRDNNRIAGLKTSSFTSWLRNCFALVSHFIERKKKKKGKKFPPRNIFKTRHLVYVKYLKPHLHFSKPFIKLNKSSKKLKLSEILEWSETKHK